MTITSFEYDYDHYNITVRFGNARITYVTKESCYVRKFDI